MIANPSPYDTDLGKNPANYVSLSPLTFLARAAVVYPRRTSVVHGTERHTWAESETRCRRLASALARRGVGLGDTVAVMAANIPALFEAHFGVPMTGGVLNALNIRLDAETIAFILQHGEAQVLLTDTEFAPVIGKALKLLDRRPLVIDIADAQGTGGERLGEMTYESFLDTGDPDFQWSLPADEWQAIALNYTSGTTGNPKGVVFHHRGAYLNGIGEILAWSMPRYAVYLWTVPMFHCNGWCFPWTLAALAGTNICLRKVEVDTVFRLIKEHGVTHYCGAPIVHNTLLNAPAALWEGVPRGLKGFIAGAAPPPSTLEAMERRGVELTHVYGLTETYGPATLCVKQEEWGRLDPGERARRNGRQGVRFLVEEEVTLLDPATLEPVPWDGETIGEIMFRGNITMKGYLKNPAATEEAFAGGWFHSGDLAVMHPDGYFKVKDRGKDIIISGGENISSLEVEDALHLHPAVFAVAVVAQPDPKWGESPRAYVELKPGAAATEADLIAHCRAHLAHYKAPKTVVFGPLPKTATGKIQKFVLREWARSAEAIE
ncbi:MAG: acyl-CoA synthetase [Gemmatimonadales bacterium]